MKREDVNAAVASRVTASLVSFRVRLSKRRAKAGTQSTTNAVLVCKHRDMNEKELEAQVSATDASQSIYCYRTVVMACILLIKDVYGCPGDRIAPFVFIRKPVKLSWRTTSQKTKRKIWTWIKTSRNLVRFLTFLHFFPIFLLSL